MSKLHDYIAAFFKRGSQAQPAIRSSATSVASSIAEAETNTDALALIAKTSRDTEELFAMLKKAGEGDPDARKFFEGVYTEAVNNHGQKAVDDFSEHIRLRRLADAVEPILDKLK